MTAPSKGIFVPYCTVVAVSKVSDTTAYRFIVLIHYSVDIWDGEKEPVITHGGTLTSKIPLRAICEAISKNAFVTSPYPVIISAEVHCGVPQQEKIAEIMRECFGETLIFAPIQGEKRDAESGLLESLPSPEQLQGRILLKVCTVVHGGSYKLKFSL